MIIMHDHQIKKVKMSPQVDGLMSTIALLTAEKEKLPTNGTERAPREGHQRPSRFERLRSQVESQGDELVP